MKNTENHTLKGGKNSNHTPMMHIYFIFEK